MLALPQAPVKYSGAACLAHHNWQFDLAKAFAACSQVLISNSEVQELIQGYKHAFELRLFKSRPMSESG